MFPDTPLSIQQERLVSTDPAHYETDFNPSEDSQTHPQLLKILIFVLKIA